MPVDLAALVDPAHTAVVTQELQGGVVGAESALPQLAEAAALKNSLDMHGSVGKPPHQSGRGAAHEGTTLLSP